MSGDFLMKSLMKTSIGESVLSKVVGFQPVTLIKKKDSTTNEFLEEFLRNFLSSFSKEHFRMDGSDDFPRRDL